VCFLKVCYSRYERLPVKVRTTIVQRALQDLGYVVDVSGQKDKKTTKAICDIQNKNDMSANGVVCETTYELLKVTKKHFKED